ncbi:hypothetical protein [Actinomyces wuliandei]|uniref:hypothetical protein n=1 Tax=Actinomyces wuliandei TaxID=2057743 RepID=UPI00111884B7|nr:hypothetical protein [Actinomyces wuliandei]
MSAGELLARSEEMLADWLREEGGERVDIEFMGVGLVQQFDPQLTRGGQRSRVIPPHEVNSFMTKLRRAQVVTGLGAWTWCRLWMVAGEWVLHQECDWMREPVLEEASGERPDPRTCALELELYPRDPENIPRWLAEGVAVFEGDEDASGDGTGTGQTAQDGDGTGQTVGSARQETDRDQSEKDEEGQP